MAGGTFNAKPPRCKAAKKQEWTPSSAVIVRSSAFRRFAGLNRVFWPPEGGTPNKDFEVMTFGFEMGNLSANESEQN
jgi:hypothetical protein